ncbi:transmembrane and TPR repeat-containing protein-like protein [Leptotrombidium deliense]|uniref:dolichyl-phosphate-mannose--protein mannosyltransferase n=1 Tax=Leptotrombidium deliense TaxID=299467 RepID=A0A443SGP3_9ACAR|nr:transmembrane and TPR repeat-containing protein-like protein [Leptotrombidium deliense]
MNVIRLIMSQAYLLLIAICMITYSNSLWCDFVFDDISAVVANSDLRSNETSFLDLFLHDFWGTAIGLELSHKSYRPLTVLTFRLNYSMHELDPFGYHLINLVLHTVVTLLFHYFSSKCLFKDEETAVISSVLFAVHPIHTEAVTGIVGRAELLAACFYFLALIAYTKSQLSLFKIFSICSLLSKEQGITVLGVCFVYELTQFKSWPSLKWQKILNVSEALLRLLLIMTIAISTVSLRIWIMGGINKFPVFTKYDNPASFEKFPIKHLTYHYLLPLNLSFLLYPYYLCCDWTMKSIPLIKSLYDVRNLWTFIFYLTLILMLKRSISEFQESKANRRTCILVLILSMICFPFVPASNLLIPVGFVVAERVLYLPSAGYCLLIAYGFKNLRIHNKKTKLFTLFVITTLAFTLKSLQRNNDWKDELSLFSSGIKVNPLNAKLYNNIGHFYEKSKNWQKAIEFFQKARSVQPDDLGASINIARTLINMGEANSAEKILWSIKPHVKKVARMNSQRIVPSYLNLWINLGNVISQNFSRLTEAEEVYLELISMRSDFVEAYINLGDVLIKQNRINDAINVYRNALNFEQKVGDIYYNLGVAHSLLLHEKSETHVEIKDSVELSSQIQKIASFFEQSLQHNYGNKEALLNLAIMIQKYPLILKSFKKSIMDRMINYIGPDQERIWFNLALLFSDESDNRTAEFYFRKAILKKPDFRSALFNLALILIDEQRLFEAEMFLSQLIQHHPNHVKSLLLLGDIYIEFQELQRAEQVTHFNSPPPKCYTSVLRQNNSNVEAMHNLCVVLTKQQRNEDANECYRKLKTITPANNSKKVENINNSSDVIH